MNRDIPIRASDIQKMITVLKNIKVKGYDSMYNLVATVDFLEGKLKEPPKKPSEFDPPAETEG